jgi:hypothetical protein
MEPCNMIWVIRIEHNGVPFGPSILSLGWNVWSRLATVSRYLPAGWAVEAYPVIEVRNA